MSLTRRAEQSR